MFKLSTKTIGIGTALLSSLLISACTMVGPDYQAPDLNIAGSWNTDNNAVKTSPAKNALWWKSFNDSTLNKLIQEGYQHNLNLQSTGINVLKARAQLAQSVGELYPQEQAISGNYTKEDLGNSSMYNEVIPSELEMASVSANVSWELDFWGKYRRAVRADDETFLSSIDAYNNALVSLTADIGNSYIAIRTYQSQIAIMNNNIVVYKESLKAAEERYKLGQASLSDVSQAKQSLEETEASLPDVVANLQKEKDALAVLIGTTPDKIDNYLPVGDATIPQAPNRVSVGIPKDILRQRPDVQEAELQAMATSEGIGAIKAQLYPALSLLGSFGYSASNVGESSVGDLFQWSNHTVSIGPSLSLPLFNYGQITNQVREQDAAFQQAILNYQNVVLEAQKEVQDGITSYAEGQKKLDSLLSANQASLKTLELTLVRYQNGEINYDDLLDAEKQQLNTLLSLVESQAKVSQSLISLYRALGGGWQLRGSNDVVPEEVKQQMADRTNWGDLLTQPNHETPKDESEKLKQTVLPSW